MVGEHTGSLCFQSTAELFVRQTKHLSGLWDCSGDSSNQNHVAKPRLPYEAVVFEEEHHEQDRSTIQASGLEYRLNMLASELRKPGVSA